MEGRDAARMVRTIGGGPRRPENSRGPRRLHPARPDGENDWRPDLVARAAYRL
jgi:hypothetical protein